MRRRLRKAAAYAGVIVMCLMAVLLPLKVQAAEDTLAVQLTVRQVFNQTGASSQTSKAFHYTMTPEKAENPMPEVVKKDGYAFGLTGNDEKILTLKYSKAGVYSYTIQQAVDSEQPGYTYDKEMYTIEVYVKNHPEGGLLSEVIVKDRKDDKVSELVFTNTYKGEIKAGTSGGSASASTSKGPKTGDNSNIVLLLVLAGVSLLGIIGSGIYKWLNIKKKV